MKTPHEWTNEEPFQKGQSGGASRLQFMEIVAQIQLDAYKQGMEYAAHVAELRIYTRPGTAIREEIPNVRLDPPFDRNIARAHTKTLARLA